MNDTSVAYDKDFYGWVNEQAQLIKSGALAQLDVNNLLETQLELLVMRSLKWRFQSDRQSRSSMSLCSSQPQYGHWSKCSTSTSYLNH